MSFTPREYLQHILDEVDFLLVQTSTLSQADFLKDDVLRRAFVRSIEIIGEAAKKVPEDFRARYSQVDWRAMAGMRDRLIHGYFSVDHDIVWNVAAHEAATLKEQIDQILVVETRSNS